MDSYEVRMLCFLLFSFVPIITALSSITPNQTLYYNETLVSASGTFEAGFFSPGNSQRQYFCIRYKSISLTTIVWVANRDTPLDNFTGAFKITHRGNPVILDGSGATVWSSNASTTAQKPIVQLLDSGNLVVRDGTNNPEKVVWQSFDYPGDTLLPGMKLQSNLITCVHNSLTSWRDIDDPAPGEFSLYIDPHGFPQRVTTKGGSWLFRAGSWNGFQFTAVPWKMLYHFFKYSFVLTQTEVYYEYELLDNSVITRVVLNPSGLSQRFILSDRTKSWELYGSGPTDQCQNYALCGANSICNFDGYPTCECLEGFLPRFTEKWRSSDWSDGCARRMNLSCNNGDGFLKYEGMKLPDTSSSWFNTSLRLEECERLCLKNCSCTAYANSDVRDGGSGCLLWFGNIMDMGTRIIVSQGQDIYIRLAASELEHTRNKKHIKKRLAGILAAISTFIIGIILGSVIYARRKLRKPGEPFALNSVSVKKTIFHWKHHTVKHEKKYVDLPTFDLSTVANATNNFCASNLLGKGGFGPVYKGTLSNGQDIAVKRLSQNSGQGLNEFRNEVVFIANLQHRNLVKILGFCIQDDERILIYEFMPNRSLDYFIFDENRSKLLDWCKRFHIICGIARGLVYLHQDSRLRIIHRDLKTSNILLDENMNPKISDFGLARTFYGDQAEANTNKVVGTYGYMSPEYAVRGRFSMKSDVFSFGVIVLEIVSGKKNRGFSDPEHFHNLLGHGWRLWIEGRPLKLMDTILGERCTPYEVIRCLNVGLLCVQQRPEDRPDMSAVVLMLNGEKLLPQPKAPGFYTGRDIPEANSLSEKFKLFSNNDISLTVLEAR